MAKRTLLPDAGKVVLDRLQVHGRDRLVMVLRPAAEGSRCPACQRISRRTHSWYKRRRGDLPWEGIPVAIELHVRRFFCDNNGCGQHIFTERLAEAAPRYARRTARLGIALEQITRALGGSAGARLAQQLGILTSGPTLLRQLRRRAFVDCARAPRVLGIDDWAWRKVRGPQEAVFASWGGRGIAMERSFVTSNVARRSICWPTVAQRARNSGFAHIPARRSSAAIAPVCMPKRPPRLRRRPYRSPIVGICFGT